MTVLAIVLILVAAVCHATWNLFAKRRLVAATMIVLSVIALAL